MNKSFATLLGLSLSFQLTTAETNTKKNTAPNELSAVLSSFQSAQSKLDLQYFKQSEKLKQTYEKKIKQLMRKTHSGKKERLVNSEVELKQFYPLFYRDSIWTAASLSRVKATVSETQLEVNNNDYLKALLAIPCDVNQDFKLTFNVSGASQLGFYQVKEQGTEQVQFYDKCLYIDFSNKEKSSVTVQRKKDSLKIFVNNKPVQLKTYASDGTGKLMLALSIENKDKAIVTNVKYSAKKSR